jgi:thiol-disulfide isomerase/thioredoxin
MGMTEGDPGTVVGAMADLSEPDAGSSTEAAEPAPPAAPRRAGRRSLDRRTVAICVVLGIAASLLTVLVASFLVEDDDAPNQQMQLQEPIDEGRLFSQPLDTPEAGTTTLAALQQDQPMLVNLFASNCVPCVEEMPLLTAAAADNPDVTFVGVATQDDTAKAEALVERTGITYPWALDPTGEFFYEAKGAGMPTTLLLAAGGKVLDTKTGAFKSASELQAFIDQAS